MPNESRVPRGNCQDTGNPVLDSLVNLGAAMRPTSVDELKKLYDTLLEVAEREPGGLRQRRDCVAESDPT